MNAGENKPTGLVKDMDTSILNTLSLIAPDLMEEMELRALILERVAALEQEQAAFAEVLPMLIELAEVEKICNSLADEIEKTRRRVHALEYVMIPQFDEAIREIKMKLDENDRGNTTRLMKTKEMLANRE